jgi:hypothetical protein
LHLQAMPKGPYSFVVVDSAPFEGVYVRARYPEGSEIHLDVVPKMLGTSRVVIFDPVGEPPN